MFAREEENDTIIVTKRRRKDALQNIEQEDGLLKEHTPEWIDSGDC